MVGTLFAPESPWWLVRHGREEEARAVVTRLTSPRNTSFDAGKAVALMVHTNALEKSISAGTSYLDCFKGIDRRRTEIACGAWMIQNLCGSAFMGYSTCEFMPRTRPGNEGDPDPASHLPSSLLDTSWLQH